MNPLRKARNEARSREIFGSTMKDLYGDELLSDFILEQVADLKFNLSEVGVTDPRSSDKKNPALLPLYRLTPELGLGFDVWSNVRLPYQIPFAVVMTTPTSSASDLSTRGLFKNNFRWKKTPTPIVLCIIPAGVSMKANPNPLLDTTVEYVYYEDSADPISIEPITFVHFKQLKHVRFPNTLTEIHRSAFMDSGLTSLSFPPSTEFIGETAFAECKNLTYVRLPPKLKVVSEKSFEGCTKLTGVEFGPNIETIEFAAFAETNIASCILPDTVTTLGSYAFHLCQNLKFVKFGANLQIIGESTFERTSITACKLPPSVQRIEELAFANNPNLKAILLPNNPNLIIGNQAFAFCNNLRYIMVPNKGIVFYPRTFYESNNIKLVVVETSNYELALQTQAQLLSFEPMGNAVIPFETKVAQILKYDGVQLFHELQGVGTPKSQALLFSDERKWILNVLACFKQAHLKKESEVDTALPPELQFMVLSMIGLDDIGKRLETAV